jgi:hypothetical protein
VNTRFARRTLVGLLLAGFAVLFLCPSMCHAQTAVTGAITGTVIGPSGSGVANVLVTATNKGTSQARKEKTGTDGVYKFSLLPPGNYRVKFTASGFKTAAIAAVTVNATETVGLNEALAQESARQLRIPPTPARAATSSPPPTAR